MPEALLKVENLKKYYPIKSGVFHRVSNFVRAVDGVSFEIMPGENFGLVGESACGKTTLGRTVLNLQEPTAGKVSFDGKVLFDVEAKQQLDEKSIQNLRKDMQIIFQDPFASLDPRWNVGRIISEGLIQHKILQGKAAWNRAEELLELCGLEKSNALKFPHEFSGGQRQRIGIARSIAVNPKFIVGDEPIAALDVSIQAQILKLLQKLIRELNLTFLFISHDLNVVRYFCDRIGVMYLGNLAEVATSDQLFTNPMHPYAKALLAAIPGEGDPKKRIILKGDVPSPAAPPSGCKFHTRCPAVMPICSQVVPVLKDQGGGQKVACHLYDKPSAL